MIIVRRVVGSSMAPALFAGDLVFARTRKNPQVGDIVIAKHKNREIIKRVDRLTKNKCYLTGDNKRRSTDSRHYGTVPRTNIKAVAVFALGTSRFARRKGKKNPFAIAGLTVFCFTVFGLVALGGYIKISPARIQTSQPAVSVEQIPPPQAKPVTQLYPVGEGRKDIPYCNDQALDIYYPRKGSATTAPVVIYLHGGGWENNNKASEVGMLDMLEPLRDEGFAVVSIDYRKLPEFSFPAPVQDALCSVRFLRASQTELGINPNKIALFGFSAGGHLAGMVGVLDSVNYFSQGQAYPEQSSRVNAVVTLAGLLDFENALRNNNILRIRYFLKGANWHSAAPASYVSSDDPPFLLIHGKQDQYVSPEQDIVFAQKLTDAGIVHEVVHVDNAEHGLGEVGGPMSISRDQIAEKIRTFIKQKLQ